MIAKRMGPGFTEVVALHYLYDSGADGRAARKASVLNQGRDLSTRRQAGALGYLERRPNPSDRRSFLLVETRAGEEAALAQMDPFMREARQDIAALSPEDREVVSRFLESVMRAMDPPAETGKDVH